MTAPIEEEDVNVPLRLQPVVARPQGWRGRSSSLVAVGLVGFIVFGIVLGSAFGDGGPSSSAAVAAASPAPLASSAPPTRRPTPTQVPLPTSLPAREVLGGQIPSERRLVYANGLQVLDLATGTLVTPARSYDDLLLPLSDDELVCACVVRGAIGADGTTPGQGVRFGRFDLNGTPIVERDLLTFDGVVPVPEMTEGFNVLAALDAGGRNLFVLDVIRRPPVWTVELHTVDVETGALVGSTVLDSLPVDLAGATSSASARPAGTTPDGIYAWANALTVSPDGRTAFVSVNASEVRGDSWTNGMHEWMVPIRNGKPRSARPLSADARLGPDSWCLGWPTFVDPTLLVRVCYRGPGQSPAGDAVVQRVTTAGESFDDLVIGQPLSDTGQPATTTIDRARRAVFIWNPQLHALARVGIDDGQVLAGQVPDSQVPGGRSPGDGRYPGVEPGLALSPDGQRLYALGIGPASGRAGASTGVWVFDPDTLGVLDHWAPRALLTSLAVSADGRFVYAAGASGLDVDGHENPWPASVTVYDAVTGEIQVVYGAVARDTWVSFPAWQ